MSEVVEILKKLSEGSLNVDVVGQMFAKRKWLAPKLTSTNPETAWKESDSDPEPFVENSFDEVVAAKDRGLITPEQYDVIVKALPGSVA